MKSRLKGTAAATGKAAVIAFSCFAVATFTGCVNPVQGEETEQTVSEAQTITLASGPLSAEYKKKDLDEDYDESAAKITFNGSSFDINGDGVKDSNGTAEITAAGTYILSGSFNGQVVVNAGDQDYVHIVLNGLDIVNESGPAIYGINCDKLTITLADGSKNSISDGTLYTFAEGEDEPDAALFCEADMSINGGGSLSVTGNYADGVKCKKDLKIISGDYEITAVSEGIKGRNSVVIKDGSLNVKSGETAIKATRDDEAEKGYVIIDGGDITINAGNDGIHAETHLTVNGGTINIENAFEGLEGQMVDITGGDVKINASDDGINASRIGSTSSKNKDGGMGFGGRRNDNNNNGAADTGNTMQNDMPDFGAQPPADMPNNGNGGENQNGEKPEPPADMENNGGNAFRGGGMPMGEGSRASDGQVYINISGGEVYVMGGSDCIDSNGELILSGGRVYSSSERYGVTGPEAVLDADGPITLKEGLTLVATGSGSGSQNTISCEQNIIYAYTDSKQSAGAEVSLKDSRGSVIASYSPEADFSSAAITSPEIAVGETYTLTMGSEEKTLSITEQTTTVGTPSQTEMRGGRGQRQQMSYTDVSSDASYYRAVSFLTGMGIISGTSDTTFSPSSSLTRAMAVTVLGRAAKADTSDSSSGFTDVDVNEYYAPYVAWACEKGIVSGYGGGKFGPNDVITEKQLQVILSNYAKLNGISFTADTSASDSAITRGEFAEALFNVISAQMTNGKEARQGGNTQQSENPQQGDNLMEGGNPMGNGNPPEGGNPMGNGNPPEGGNPMGNGNPPEGGNPMGNGNPPEGGNPMENGNPPEGGNSMENGNPPEGGFGQ